MKVPFVDLTRTHKPLMGALRRAQTEVLQKNQFILGEQVQKFENEFAKFAGSRFAVGVASGTDALHLSLRAAGIGAGDEVLIPAMTFAATALAVIYSGATPIAVDVEERNALMDLKDAERAITPRTKAMIPVHLYGQPCEMEALMKFAARHHLVVIEDACQAHGAKFRGQGVGTFGLTGCFSFFPSKNLGALGDGGLVVTEDETIYQQLLKLRNYGQPRKYVHETLGYNSRLDGLQAAFLRIKLKPLAKANAARRRHAARYLKALARLPVTLMGQQPESTDHVYHLFVIQTDQRDALMKFLHDRGIESGIHYPVPMQNHGFMTALGPQRACPVAARLSPRVCSLPMFPELTPKEIDHVVKSLGEFF